MALKERIMNDLKKAMKERNEVKVRTLRMVIASIKNWEVENTKEIDDDGMITVLTKEAKRRKEAIEEYRKAGREDLVRAEEEELKIIESYLPERMSEEEIKELVLKTIEEVKATSPKDLGKVMKVIMPKVKGRADGKLVNEMVRKILSDGQT
ncbi:MAG: glutamyl-tRNA amidotransferase [Thermotoga sp. 4484_232]|nr:MAG: glutamyl-tRNA amidotransferase [Thermotoga sp. 4484_232]RKX41313.1 MAG: GatB/YqeY domain-containing protein [Thermotogota bacterium]RKX52388.1 MAG: GatB/YqeY domain-containing protein [Thermotoga sp.]